MSVFISYRKDDARPWAISLRDHLARTFGERQVFIDLDSLQAGRWRPQIDHALDESTIVLVLIGPRWTATLDANGRNRLFLEDDVHRGEVASALKRADVVVIPVLVDGARLPQADELPEDLRPLLDRQVSEIGDARGRRVAEMRKLTRTIDELTGQRRQRRRAIAALTAILLVGVVNTRVATDSPLVAAVFVVMAASLSLWAWKIYRRMARAHMKGTRVALLTTILSSLLLTGSLIRLGTSLTSLTGPVEISRNGEP